MSGASDPLPPATTRSAGAVAEPVVDSCPLCGAPLHPDRDWCLHCGAAARTRLAASSNWKAPIIAVAIVAALALAVLAAALVKLAGNSGSTSTPGATSVARPASVTSPGAATVPPTPSASTPVAAAPPVGLKPATRVKPSSVQLNGAVDPQGVPTTYQFHYGTTTRYGGVAPNPPVPLGAGTSAIAVNSKIAFLTPGTTYHYKLTATKAGHAISTADATFTMPRR